MWIEQMKAKEAEEQQEQMPDEGGSSRSPNPSRQPGGGGSGVGGDKTKFVNNGISNDENPNAHLKDKLNPD